MTGAERDRTEAATEMRMGFTVDVVDYSGRSAPARSALQKRLDRLVRDVLADVRLDLADLEHQRAGDSMHVILPLNADATRALPGLINSLDARLRADNGSNLDRMKLRMACDFGTFKVGANGFEGEAVIGFCRLVECSPVRQAIGPGSTAHLAVLVSEFLYQQIVRMGYTGLDHHEFAHVTAQVKGYQADAWLYTAPGDDGSGLPW
jgi:hypothetical protein